MRLNVTHLRSRWQRFRNRVRVMLP